MPGGATEVAARGSSPDDGQARVGRAVGRQRAPQRRRRPRGRSAGAAMPNWRNVVSARAVSATRSSRPWTAGAPSGERAAISSSDLGREARDGRSPSGLVNSSAAFGASSGSPSDGQRGAAARSSTASPRPRARAGSTAVALRRAGSGSGRSCRSRRRSRARRGRAAACRAGRAAARAARARDRSWRPSRSAAAGRSPPRRRPQERGASRSSTYSRWPEVGGGRDITVLIGAGAAGY